MGCFSYICKNSGEPVLSSSFSGDAVHLFLLLKGEVREHMFGNYDSYGRVFDGTGDSFEWDLDWQEIVDLHFNGDNTSGIAAILATEFDGKYPTTISDGDPNQGWGKHGHLMGSVTTELGKEVKEPFHKVFKPVKIDDIKTAEAIAFEKVSSKLGEYDKTRTPDEVDKLVRECQELLKKVMDSGDSGFK